MRIRILAPGKIKEKWLNEGILEYKKRLSKYTEIEIVELKDFPDSMPEEQVLKAEGDLILSKISKDDFVWVMDLHGKLMTSEEISDSLIKDLEKGGSRLTVVIGGSNGLSPDIIKRANKRICFGNITLTHQMTRLILLEQLYRSFKIAYGEKYHK